MGNQPGHTSGLRSTQRAPVVVAIDDDRVILRVIAKTLASAGMICHTATTGAAGLQLIREHQADLVLLDILLDGEDGFTLCREFRRTWSPEELPVIMVTGLEDLESIQAAYTSGANDFLAKPLHWKHLPYRIWHVLQAGRDSAERKAAESALRESERMLNRLIDNLPGFVYRGVHVGHWTLGYLSDGFREITGYRTEDFALSPTQVYNDLIVPSHREAIRMKWQQALQEKSVFEEEYPIATASGETRWVWERGRGTYDGEGRLLFVEGFVTDITQRKRMEEALRETEAQNHQIQKAESLSRMAGAIAHHFNNKLQSVMANLELMGEHPEGVDPARYLTRAKQATEKAAEVSRLLLIYLGQGSGRGEPLSLTELCLDSLAHLQGTLPNTQILEADCPSPGPVIKANADQIQQVIASLVANAREALSEARGSIRLGLSTCCAAEIPAAHRFPIGWQPQESGYACLAVTDTGCGIVDTDIDQLFDPFFSTKFTGRGLGLSVVLGIVQTHGGAITVESKPGQGSVFRIYLPVSTEARLSVPEREVQAPALAGVGTLLLVDDDEGLRMATGALIEKMGFTLLTAKDGVEAVEVFRQHQAEICCVITDLTMPRLDGWGTLTALRRITPSIPVVLASGYDKAQVMSGEHPEHPQALLSKPFNFQQLRDAVGQALAAKGRQ